MQKENSKKIGLVILGVLVLAGTFYAGMSYGGNNVRAAINSRAGTFGQNGMMGARSGKNVGNFGGFTTGQIISKDANSITVQIGNAGSNPTQNQGGPASTSLGGSKIIFLNSNTKVLKQTTGTLTDLAVGTQVSITGTPNTDGSINADSVQIRPNTTPVLK